MDARAAKHITVELRQAPPESAAIMARRVQPITSASRVKGRLHKRRKMQDKKDEKDEKCKTKNGQKINKNTVIWP